MVVIVDVSGDGGVIVIPLLYSDNSVAVPIAEAGQELHEHFFGSHLTALDLWVLAGVINSAQVCRGDRAVAIAVELGEALVDNSLSVGVWRAANAVEELVVTDDAILVRVKVVEESLSLTHVDVHSVILQAPVELLLVDLTVAVVVHDAEGAAHTTNGPDSAGSQAGFHLLKNLRDTGKKHS